MNNSTFLYILLGLLAALATVVNNMFSPAMPSMVEFFGASQSMVQVGFTTGMMGLALGQLLFGPLSDKIGRRYPLLVSMVLFTISTLCILPVTNVGIFVALRFVQGFTAGGAIAISRSIATDNFDQRSLLKAMAAINIINGLAPILTPMMGGAAVSMAGWHGVFVVMLITGVALTVGCVFLKESLPVDRRHNRGFLATFRLFAVVLHNRTFLAMLLHQAAALSILFGNIASSAFIAQHYGIAPVGVGIALAVNGVFLGIGAGVAARFGSALVGVRVSCCGMIVMSLIVASVLGFDMGYYAYEVAMCMMLTAVGITLTSSTAHAMESAREHAGTASALFGAAGFLVGGVVSPIVGMGNMLHSTALTFVVSALLSTLFFALLQRSTHK